MPPHRPGGKPHRLVVGEHLLQRPAHQLPDDLVAELRLDLPGARVDADEGLEDQVHEVGKVPPPPTLLPRRLRNERCQLVDGGIPQDRLHAIEGGDAGRVKGARPRLLAQGSQRHTESLERMPAVLALRAWLRSRSAANRTCPATQHPAGIAAEWCLEFGKQVSGGAVVLVDEPAEHVDALDRACRRRELVGRHRDLECDPTVRAGKVVMSDVG